MSSHSGFEYFGKCVVCGKFGMINHLLTLCCDDCYEHNPWPVLVKNSGCNCDNCMDAVKNYKPKMKVTYLSPYPPNKGGFISRKAFYDELSKHCETKLIDWNVGRVFGIFKRMKQIKNALKTSDILFIEYYFVLMPLIIPFILLFKRKAKIVLRLHEDYENIPLARLIIAYNNFLYGKVDMILVHTQEHRFKLPERVLFLKSFVVPHGIILNKIKRKIIPNTILLPGFIAKWKGHDLAVRALNICNILDETENSITLNIVGKCNDKKFLSSLSNHYVNKNNEYVIGKEYLDYFRKCEIVIVPYRRIVMSGIVCDILSNATPCIISDLPGLREFTQDKLLYFKNGDVEDLANKIKFIIGNKKEQRRQLKEIMKLREEYSWKKITQQTLEHLKSLL